MKPKENQRKERNLILQQEQELKRKIREFTKKHFDYKLDNSKLSEKVKEELKELGAWKPHYKGENDRALLYVRLLSSKVPEVREICIREIERHFGVSGKEVEEIAQRVRDYHRGIRDRVEKMRNARYG